MNKSKESLSAHNSVSVGERLAKSKDKYIVELIPGLYFGNHFTAANFHLLREHSIQVIINLTHNKYYNKFTDDFIYETFYIKDNTSEDLSHKIDTILKSVANHLALKRNIFIHCNKGISRAPSIAIAYLIKCKDLDFNEAFKIVKAKSPAINPNLGFLIQLQTLGDKHRPSPPDRFPLP